MVTVNLRDAHLVENLKALQDLRNSGNFTDEELQEIYDKQLEKGQKGVSDA